MMNLKSKQSGVSLIEVMVATFLLMIGLLGIMGVQVFSQRQVMNSSQRSIVVQATNNVIERMRANNVGAVCGMYLPAALTGAPASCTAPPAVVYATQANQDLLDWRNQLTARLGPVTSNITRAATGEFRIEVMWNERDATALDPACPNTAVVGQRCFNTIFLP